MAFFSIVVSLCGKTCQYNSSDEGTRASTFCESTDRNLCGNNPDLLVDDGRRYNIYQALAHQSVLRYTADHLMNWIKGFAEFGGILAFGAIFTVNPIAGTIAAAAVAESAILQLIADDFTTQADNLQSKFAQQGNVGIVFEDDRNFIYPSGQIR